MSTAKKEQSNSEQLSTGGSATRSTMENLHLINSLKRMHHHRIPNRKLFHFHFVTSLKSLQPEPRLNIKINRSRLCRRLVVLLFTIVMFAMNHLNTVIECDNTFCPKDLSHMYPCTCQNGTQGLLVRCTSVNLPILSKSLSLIRETVEQVEIESSFVSQLFGPLLSDSQMFPFHMTIRELDVRGSGLQSIDMEAFSKELLMNLQYFMLDRNRLQQVPSQLVNNMTNLRLLNLSANAIGSIEANAFVKLTNLTDLDLSWNKITRLNKNSFQSLTALEFLSLNGNELAGKLEKSVFALVRKLRHLDLSNNKLTSLDRQDFAELTALEVLRISNNQITTLPRSIFSRNAKMFTLDMSFNKLEDIDTYLFKSTRFLRDLNMSGNLIKDITKNTFSPTTRIKRIDMSQNLLQALAPETFKGLEWLERLDLSHNQIVNISNDAFSKIFQVEIDLSHNRLTRIFYWAFHEVSNMTKLDLSHNLLEDASISPISFESTDCALLNLSYNQIQDIAKMPISNLTGLRLLDLSHNQITEFNKKSFSEKRPMYELHTIDASYNNISQISGNIFERLKSLRLFNVSHNSLRRLTSGAFGSSPTLLELDLSHNNLVEIVSGTLVNLISMRDLDLRHNRLKKMIPVPVALNSIRLEHNEIGQLSKAAFPSLNSLLEMHLDHNKLTNIEDGTFATLLALHTLSLSYNNISTIPAGALKDLTSLQNLHLNGNNIQRLSRRAFGTLPIVFKLSLDHNNITTISDHAFDGMLQLLELNLSHNNLVELPPEAFANLVSLRTLDLSYNQLNRFENKTRSAMEDLLSLEVANFSNNKLSLITARTFLNSPYIPYKLTRLDLSHNLIGILAGHFANGLKRLEWLSLRANIINEIMPGVIGNISFLRHLDLSNNKLRILREGTFVAAGRQSEPHEPGELQELATVLLNNNKLTRIAQPREFDQLRSLNQLDLSNNRLEGIFAESYRWLRRGVAVDLRNNNLECNCNQLPLVAWVDNFRTRNHSYSMVLSDQHNHDNANSNQPTYERLARNRLTSKLLSRYIEASALISDLTCARPEIISGKTIMQMLDLVNMHSAPSASSPLSSSYHQLAAISPAAMAAIAFAASPLPHVAAAPPAPILSSTKERLSCDRDSLNEVDLLKRLKAPIQYNGAEPYFFAGEQHLKIGWTLLDPQLEMTHFVLVRAKFSQPFDLAIYRTSASPSHQLFTQFHQSQLNTQVRNSSGASAGATGGDYFNLKPLEYEIERLPYSERTLVMRNINPNHFYVVCITYASQGIANGNEPNPSSSTLTQSPPTTATASPSHSIATATYSAAAMIELLNKTDTSTAAATHSTLFAAIIADYSRINCASLNSLLQIDVSERLVSSSPQGRFPIASAFHLAKVIFYLFALNYSTRRTPIYLFSQRQLNH